MQQYAVETGFGSDHTVRDRAWLLQPRKITVDPSINFYTLLRLGKYDRFGFENNGDRIITEDNFPLQLQEHGKYEVDTELVPYAYATVEQERPAFSKPGFRLATPGEYLTFGYQYPEVQQHVRLECLMWAHLSTGRHVLCLDGNSTQRGLSCRYAGTPRNPETCAYLTVRTNSLIV